VILSDRLLLTVGFACCVFAIGLQAHRHALWFQLQDPYQHAAVSVGREATSPISEVSHSLVRNHRGQPGAARTSSTVRHQLAHVTGRTALARATVVAPSSVLHPPARVGRLASGVGGLAWCAVTVRRGPPVHAADMGVGGRSRGAVAVVAARAVLPGMGSVGC
jgi:hypothetical protein